MTTTSLPGPCLAVLISLSACAESTEYSRDATRAFEGAEIAFPGAATSPARGRFFVGDVAERLDYEFRGGYAIFEGDVVLGHVDRMTPAQRGDDTVPTSAVKPNRLWVDGVVPYSIADVGPETADAFMAAVVHWEDKTALRFVERTDEIDYVRVIEAGGCWSYIGRTSGPQELSLGPGCAFMGIAAHEIGHAIGFWHEQSRADRDANVIVHWDNIKEGRASAFETYDERGYAGQDVGGYDTGSIMHYGSTAFSVDYPNLPTITRLDGSWIVPNRQELSAGDIGGAAMLYGEPEAPPEPPPCAASMSAGQRLEPGEELHSCDQRFRFVMQADGNLVLYQGAAVLWNAHTQGNPGAHLRMQFDGNLVVYQGTTPLWNAHTQGNPGATMTVHNDGNVVVHRADGGAAWATGTGGH